MTSPMAPPKREAIARPFSARSTAPGGRGPEGPLPVRATEPEYCRYGLQGQTGSVGSRYWSVTGPSQSLFPFVGDSCRTYISKV